MSNLIQEREPQDDTPPTKNFKVILALKLENNNYGLNAMQCQVSIQDKIKVTDLPQQEGQFFDLSDLPVGTTIEMAILTQHFKLGQISVSIPASILQSEETELSNSIVINSTYKNKKISLKFKYYIIILNKKIFLEKNSKKIFRHHEIDSTFFEKRDSKHLNIQKVDKSQSPSTVKFIKSQQEHEDSKYNQTIGKRLLEGREKTNKLNKTQKSDAALTPSRSAQDRLTPTNRRTVHDDSDRISPIKNSKSIHYLAQKAVSPFLSYNDKQSHRDLKEQAASKNKMQIEIDYLKKKLLAHQSDQHDSINQSILRDSLFQSEQRRNHLQDTLKNSVEDNNKLKEEVQNSLQVQMEARQQADKQSHDVQQKLQGKFEDLELELTKRNNQILELEQKNALIEEFVKLCKEQQAKLEAQDKRIKVLQEPPHQAPKDQGRNINQLKQLTDQLSKVRADLVKEQGKTNQLQTQVDGCQNRMSLDATKLSAVRGLHDQNDKLNKLVKELRDKNDELLSDMQELRAYKAPPRVNDSEAEEAKKLILQLRRAIAEQTNQLDEKNMELLKMKYNLQELRIKLDQKQNKEDMMSHNANLVKENVKLLETVNELTQQLRATNKHLLEARLTAKDYETEAEDKDAYLNDMKRLILQMKERGQVYMPNNKDKTDRALAECLNSKEDYEQIRNMFSRESEGVYQFGSKKLYVKVEQDNKVKIRYSAFVSIYDRSGGGFISLEEFLQLFSQTEMEKLSRQDPLINMSKNKALQRKMDDMRLVKTHK